MTPDENDSERTEDDRFEAAVRESLGLDRPLEPPKLTVIEGGSDAS